MLTPAVLAVLAEGITPLDSASGSVLGYLLGYGPLGIAAVALFGLYVWPGRGMKRARDEARQDLLEENGRLRELNARLAAQRDEALTVLRDQVAPILITFNSTMGALLPVMQDMVRARERESRGGDGHR